MDQIPAYLAPGMALVTLATVFLFYRASHYRRSILILLLLVLAVQGAASALEFYSPAHGYSPRFFLLVVPEMMVILALLLKSKGRQILDTLDLKGLTLLHTVRIAVELLLFGLYQAGVVPQLMTFEDGNLDILSGLSAPIVTLIAFRGSTLRFPNLLLVWNFVCLGLLFNIVVRAILAVPAPFQQWGFTQPNTAILYFPFSWLPCCIVPLVLLSHIVSIRSLLLARSGQPAFALTQP